jgi:TonB family protein
LPLKPTTVKVLIGRTGLVIAARVVRSSGDPASDEIALRLARRSTYEPARRDCRAVESTYLYVEDWQRDVTIPSTF